HPDSVYGWWWTYYSPTGVPLDSGVTSVTCLYPTQPGLYSLVYGVNPRPNARTAQGRRYTFYLNFGARTTAASSLAERIPILYPNPTSGTVYLQLPSTVPYRVEVKDVLGRCHYHTELMGGDTHRLTLPLPSGLYLMEVKSNEHNTSFRLLIQ
ncbi:MAG: T9SS type A sorting domain-containing protein, partial [Bacteroidia bacterium]|nr:T9SS type A sorting domain-containing protein [Bacteroidia bacterium]